MKYEILKHDSWSAQCGNAQWVKGWGRIQSIFGCAGNADGVGGADVQVDR